MNDPMTILKADHREVRTILKELAETDEGARRETLTTQVVEALTVHMEIEERLVYPKVAELVGDDDAEEANVEHGLVRETLPKLSGMTSEPGFGAVVEMLLAGIEHHVKEEESELLPSLKEQMERTDWLTLGDAVAEAKAAAGHPVPAAPRRRSAKRAPRATSNSRKR